MQQIERAGEQEARGKAGLRTQPLLMQDVRHVGGRVEVQPLTRNNEDECESAKQGQQDPVEWPWNQRVVPKASCARDRGGMESRKAW